MTGDTEGVVWEISTLLNDLDNIRHLPRGLEIDDYVYFVEDVSNVIDAYYREETVSENS